MNMNKFMFWEQRSFNLPEQFISESVLQNYRPWPDGLVGEWNICNP